MRDIKFRAWDKESKKMIYEEVFGNGEDENDGFTKLVEDGGDVFLVSIFANGNCEYESLTSARLMQYTGLKDKDGIEIYESDQVGTPAGIGVVKWDRCFNLFWNNKDSTTLHDCVEEQLEVIGNIYKNPELVEK